MSITKQEFYQKYKGEYIPIVNWDFFKSLEVANKLYNIKTIKGWNADWQPFASNGLGDPIFFYKDSICIIGHDTDDTENRITKDLDSLDELLQKTKQYKELSDDEKLELLKEKKKIVKSLKKLAPRILKYDFTIELDDIEDKISELKDSETDEGKFRQHGLETIQIAINQLQKDGKYKDLLLGYKYEDKKYMIFYSLCDGESLETIKVAINNHLPKYPVEYIEDTL